MIRERPYRPAWPNLYAHPDDDVAVYTAEDGPFDECPLMQTWAYHQCMRFGYAPVMDQENIWRAAPLDTCFDRDAQRDFERIVFEVFGLKERH